MYWKLLAKSVVLVHQNESAKCFTYIYIYIYKFVNRAMWWRTWTIDIVYVSRLWILLIFFLKSVLLVHLNESAKRFSYVRYVYVYRRGAERKKKTSDTIYILCIENCLWKAFCWFILVNQPNAFHIYIWNNFVVNQVMQWRIVKIDIDYICSIRVL